MSNINVGIDVDGTLTNEIIGRYMMSFSPSEIKKAILDCTPKNGIDILFENFDRRYNYYIITGRLEAYKYETAEWLDMYGIPYKELIMFPDNFYEINGYSIPKYVNLKIEIHIKNNIWIAIDDNEHVIKGFNDSGIMAYKVDDNFRHVFEKMLQKEGT